VSSSKRLTSKPLTSTRLPEDVIIPQSNQLKCKRGISRVTALGEKSQASTHEKGTLTVSDVRLTLAPVDELIPVERRLPAPKEIGVYALVPAALGRQEASDGNPFGLQRMSQDDAMGFALGAATGNRSGSIDGPGWTLLDPAAAPVADNFSPGGPLLSNSPRRTLRVEFTCNKCWERTTRAINPQAYKTGTVFVQCKGCNIFHKLVDNLKLFHELQGPIYTPPGQLFHTPYDPFKATAPGGFDGLPFV
jgi:protein import protein ZIM17